MGNEIHTNLTVLWLTSWYPTEAEPFNGDFIQRHAKAAALYNNIYVVHVGGSSFETSSINQTQENLVENIILYKSRRGLIGKFFNHWKWQKLFKNAVSDYIQKHGKPDLVHVHVPVKAGLIALWLKRKFNIPYIVTEHWGIYNDVLKENFNDRPEWFKKITKKIFSNAVACSSVSKFLADKIQYYVSDKLNFAIINNVANTDFFYPAQKHSTKFRFIHVSSMIDLKKAEIILTVFSESDELKNNAELMMVGSTNGFIQTMAGDLGLLNKSVFIKKEVPYKSVAEEMQKADCLVLFSEMENSPCVIAEALCCGLRVIATKVGGIPELVNEGNSILVEAGNNKQLESAMLKMKNNYTIYDKNKIAEAAKNRFSYPVIGKQFDELYQSVLTEV